MHQHFDTNAQKVEIYTGLFSLFLAKPHRILTSDNIHESRNVVPRATGFSGNFHSRSRGARWDLFPNPTFSFGRIAECDYPVAPRLVLDYTNGGLGKTADGITRRG